MRVRAGFNATNKCQNLLRRCDKICQINQAQSTPANTMCSAMDETPCSLSSPFLCRLQSHSGRLLVAAKTGYREGREKKFKPRGKKVKR
jgi:hypothetical protein